MEEIKTIDALFAKKFTEETPYVQVPKKTTDIKRFKLNKIEELFIPSQPISLIIKSSEINE